MSLMSNSPRWVILNLGALRTGAEAAGAGAGAGAGERVDLDAAGGFVAGGWDDALAAEAEGLGAAGGGGPADALRMRWATGTPPL